MAALFALYAIFGLRLALTYYNEQSLPISQTIAQRIDFKDELDLWIDQLETYECENCAKTHKTLDTNDKYSHGCLQFQDGTFIEYIRRYKLLPNLSDKEILLQIYDCELQKKTARLMILENYDNWEHWFTSVYVRGLGLPPKINDNKPTETADIKSA